MAQLPSPGAQSARATLYAYVGCYTTTQRSARGDGIHVYRIDPASGSWTQVQHVPELVNPSFLVFSAAGNIAVLPIRPDGALGDAVRVIALPWPPGPRRIEQVSSHPHHVVFTPAASR